MRTFDETLIREDGSVNIDHYGVLRSVLSVQYFTVQVRTGLYASHLEDWYQHFPRHQIHLVNGDRLIKVRKQL